TGFLVFEYSIAAKWLELLKEIAPRVTRAVVLRESAIAAGPAQFSVIQAAAPSLGMEVRPVDMRDAGEIERALTAVAQGSNGDRDWGPGGAISSYADRYAGRSARITRRLLRPQLRHRRRPDRLWNRFDRPEPSRCRLRRSHPQGREARSSFESPAHPVKSLT